MDTKITSQKLLSAALHDINELKALNVTSLDVKELTTLIDYMIIATGTSSRHVHSIADHLIQHMKSRHIPVYGVEGDQNDEWILVDLGNLIVHIMQEKTRTFYNLEKLWSIPMSKPISKPDPVPL